MAREIKFTEQPIRISATGAQALTQVLPTGGAKTMDLILSCYGLTGTSPTLDIGVHTSMQADNEDAWGLAASFSQITSANQHKLATVSGLLKYVRYYASLGGSGGPTATFEISGIARDA